MLLFSNMLTPGFINSILRCQGGGNIKFSLKKICFFGTVFFFPLWREIRLLISFFFLLKHPLNPHSPARIYIRVAIVMTSREEKILRKLPASMSPEKKKEYGKLITSDFSSFFFSSSSISLTSVSCVNVFYFFSYIYLCVVNLCLSWIVSFLLILICSHVLASF